MPSSLPNRSRRLGRLASSMAAALCSLLAVGGCSDLATDMGMSSSAPATVAPTVERKEPVTRSSRPAAVLSVHMRKSYPNACKLGITLTNNLPNKIVAISYRMTGVIRGDVGFDTQMKSFGELAPSESQYRELTFQGVRCEDLVRLEVSDPGRCNVGELNRFNAEPGACAKLTDLASGGLLSMVWKKK
jgi:hypothetical protein